MKRGQKILLYLSLSVVLLTLLSYYSNFIFRIGKGDQSLGSMARPAAAFATFPSKVSQILVEELGGVPPTYVEKDKSFNEVNKLDYNLYGINGLWNQELRRWEVMLFNFRTDSIIYRWHVDEKGLELAGMRQFPNSQMRNPILLEDKSLIVSNDMTPNLIRIDSNSNILWKNHELVFHHSLNIDADSNVWACTTDRTEPNSPKTGRPIKNLNGHTMDFLEDYITKIDKNTGKILFKKGVSEILLENNYKNFVYGFSNPPHNLNDPLHLNDIEPVLTDSKYWKKGDLFLSMRHRSLVMLYRPSSNKILRLIYGPFINQHDVDIISDEEISIFNNNYIVDGEIQVGRTYPEPAEGVSDIDSLVSSEIMVYNFGDSSFRHHLTEQLADEKVKTYSQGFHQMLRNGDVYVEAQNFGKLYILNKNGFVLKKQIASPNPEFVHMPNWIRIFEELNF